MSTALGTLIFVIGIAGLFFLDREKGRRPSWLLWAPTVWLFFCFSRALSQWLQITPEIDRANIYVEGSPIDAALYEILEIIALIAVVVRRDRVLAILRKNLAICLFFLYAAFSIAWSDFPFVTLKHWIKGIGDWMMILIILTEPNVSEAIKRVFTRLAFLLIPISVLLIKYYGELGRRLTLSWTMEPIGVATQKNGLGELCDFTGLVLLWRFRAIYRNQTTPYRKGKLIAIATVLGMIVWLLWMCNSMTSICALSMASLLMFVSETSIIRRKPARVHLLISGLILCALYALFFQSSGSLIESLGRNPTLTGRTDIWELVVTIPKNHLIGTGYESFWLGDRLQTMWRAFPGLQLNEAHNGYIEILLTLGWAGLVLFGVVLVTGYLNLTKVYRRDPEFGGFKLAVFLAAVVTGLTEAAFRIMGPPWTALLLVITVTPLYLKRSIDAPMQMNGDLASPDPDLIANREEAAVGMLNREWLQASKSEWQFSKIATRTRSESNPEQMEYATARRQRSRGTFDNEEKP